MSKRLNWSSRQYEDNEEFVANIAEIHFNDDQSLSLNYSIEREFSTFILYFECNAERFNVGQYEMLEIAREEAEKHYEKNFVG